MTFIDRLCNDLRNLPFRGHMVQGQSSIKSQEEYRLLHNAVSASPEYTSVIDLIAEIITTQQMSASQDLTLIANRPTQHNHLDQMVKTAMRYKQAPSAETKDSLTAQWADYSSSKRYNIQDMAHLIDETTDNISIFLRLEQLVQDLPLHDETTVLELDKLTALDEQIKHALVQQYTHLSILQRHYQNGIRSLEKSKATFAPFLSL